MASDPKDLIKRYYSPAAKEPEIITIPSMNYLMIDGHGDPNNNPAYSAVVSALYTLSYTLKFELKKVGTPEYKVFPLEGLWWSSDMDSFLTGDKSAWNWTMMMAQPEWITDTQVNKAKEKAAAKVDRAVLDKVRFEPFEEGLVMQMMHIGPYSAEGPNIARLHAFAKEKGYALFGKHHEIYIGNPQKAAPEKLKTILRQPIRR